MASPQRRRRPNKGRWELERERFQLPADSPIPSEGGAVPIGDLAAGLLKRAGLEDRMWERTLIDEWHALVGDAVARRARPGAMQRGVLTVYVSNAAWMAELSRYGKQALLEKLQARFGVGRIKDLRFHPDPDLQPGAREGGR